MKTPTNGPPRSGSSVDRVYEALRSAIVMGHYPPGGPLRLHELSEDLGVSLIPIREALRRLEVERLVDNRPYRGAVVASISLSDVRDAYGTRILLESEALRRAWPNIDEEALGVARNTLDEMFAAFEAGRMEEGAQLHGRYHFDLWARAESPWLDHLIRILWSHTERYRNLALVLQTPARAGKEYHQVVLAALESRDLDSAILHTREELSRARDLVIEHLSDALGMKPETRPA
ncbi:MAG: GntR family transcriptional regulator [Acidimicrobiia bacterium]